MVSLMNESTFLEESLPYVIIIPYTLEKILWYNLHLETIQKNKI